MRLLCAGGHVTDRELRLRQRIDTLTDERDRYRAQWERAAAARDSAKRSLAMAKKSRELWRTRYFALRRMAYTHTGAGRFRKLAA